MPLQPFDSAEILRKDLYHQIFCLYFQTMKINQHYLELTPSYLFREVAQRAAAYQEKSGRKLIRMGIGDVTRPLPETVVSAMIAGAEQQLCTDSFRGYGPEQGYSFLRSAIRNYHPVHPVAEDIFISDGAKTDLGAILDLFDQDNTVAVPDPVYPVYADTNLMDGRRIVFMEGSRKNGFCPLPEDMNIPKGETADIIYLCSPNNPTGAVYSFDALQTWVDYANAHDSVILFDAAYEAFIEEDLPRSIYQIPGAETCAIEFGSFSKMAGFTGLRCAWTVVPSALIREGSSLHDMWQRRQSTKMNGVSYPVQRAAEAALSPEGLKACRENIAYYKENAHLMAQTLKDMGLWFAGGINSPYLWVECPEAMSSWEFFDDLLEKCEVVGTPGSGFGSAGEGYLRLTAFGSREDTEEAMRRMKKAYQ